MSLSIHNLTITRDGNEVVRGVSLELPKGELHVLMGKNGSGKSSLAAALMGHPAYVITGGTATLDGEGLLALAPHERSRKGLFLSPQHPPEVAGVSISNFLRTALNVRREQPMGPVEFYALLKGKLAELGIDASFAARNLNEGFSGGERKRMELLQLAILAPQYAVLDEMDSGLDVDAVKAVAAGLAKLRTDMGVLAITHRPETLASLSPDKVYVMDGGRIVETGGPELAERISREGFGNP
jgi:Fe-S cluster assembly ATP-binding protein